MSAAPAKAPRVGCYLRVSTAKQDHAVQIDELRAAAQQRGYEIVREYVDTGSGSGKKLPERDRLMADARAGKVDIALCWRFDRFARSLRDLLDALDTFRGLGVDFVSLKDNIDTSTPAGKLAFQVLGAVSEFIRCIIVENVKAGLEAAKRRGKKLGRPVKPVDLGSARELLRQGLSPARAARRLGIGATTLRRALVHQKPGSGIHA